MLRKNTSLSLGNSPLAGPRKEGADNENVPVSRRRYVTVKQMLSLNKYGWATNSFIRHAIFQAEDRIGSGRVVIPGNGLAPAILRIGRKILIDLDEFDHWVEQHRLANARRRGPVDGE